MRMCSSSELKKLDYKVAEGFWYRVNRLTKERKLTQVIVADQCNIHSSTYKNWSHIKRFPELPEIYLMSQVLEVSMNYLIFGQEAEPRTEYEYIIGQKILSAIDSIIQAVK